MVKTKRWQLCSMEEEQENAAAKRTLQSPAFAYAGCSVPDSDALKWLRSHGLLDLAQRNGPQSLNFWYCTAEFNVLLRAFQHSIAELPLLNYHSFTRSPKPLAFEKMAWSQGCSGGSLGVVAGQHQHLHALAHVLDAACSDCSEVSISQLTFAAPTWLDSWCRKWLPAADAFISTGPGKRITVTGVQAYTSQPAPLRASAVYNIGFPIMTTVAPHKTVYLPMLPQ